MNDSIKVQVGGSSLSSFCTTAGAIIEPPVLLRSSRESGRWVQEEDVMPYSGLFYFIPYKIFQTIKGGGTLH